MKNNFIIKLSIAVMAVLFNTAGSASAIPPVSPETRTMITKFLLAMAGVVVFSIIISAGLAIYNRFFVAKQIKDFKMNNDSLRTPVDKDEAIMSFITKNRD